MTTAGGPQQARPSRSTDQAIASAELTAFMRALATRERDERVRGPDYLAEHFLGPAWRVRLRFPWLARRLLERISPGAYYYTIARTRHIDSLLIEELEHSLAQLLILGAGNDSRAYRFHERLQGVRVFEVDFPGTQAWKKERLAQALGALPAHVTYVPIDLNTLPLAAALAAAGYDPGRRTFAIWEGVSYYLSAWAVEDVLRTVAQGSSAGSSLVFDYALQSFVDAQYTSDRARKVAEAHARLGEPFIFGLAEGSTEAYLGGWGLRLISDLGPGDLERRYLVRRDGRIYGRVPEYLRIAHVAVP